VQITILLFFCVTLYAQATAWALLTSKDSVLQHNIDFTTETIITYTRSVAEFNLSPSEYLVWHALVFACSNADKNTNNYFSVSIADIIRCACIQRETVKRALLRLEECKLARRIQNRWIFSAIDIDE
jgi:hypothetical protein